MKLKKIELFGFKSFADRTEILFDQGVTCVVGPNGCGKSNISDAMRWVLGERSAKLLRGSKMEDVIFNGTDFRKPLGMAEVTLTIDNQDRGLPIDYSEVAITRRLYRNGDSEYLINKTLCRLKDIQDLILDTGIGSSSYSMIEQGRIDYILSADPDERRFLIEEAAGISKYKVKKEEAIRKLERTEENRTRLNDIIQEVKKNIQYAERQARRAERYKEQLEQLKDLEIRKSFYELTQIAEGKHDLSQQNEKLAGELREIEAALQVCRQTQAALTETLNGILDRYASEDAKKHGLQSTIEQLVQQMNFHQEKRMEMASRGGEIQQEIRQLTDREASGQKELASKKAEIELLNSEKGHAQSILNQSQERMDAIESSLTQIKNQMEQLKGNAFQAASETSSVRNEYHRLTAFVDSSGQQITKLKSAQERFTEEHNARRVKIQDCSHKLQNFHSQIQNLESENSKLKQTETDLESAFCEAQEKIQTFEKRLHEKRARLDMLAEIDAASRAGEDAIIQEHAAAHQTEFIKSLREIFTVKPGYEWALEAALESFSRTIVADNKETAKKLLASVIAKKVPPMGLLVRDFAASYPEQKNLDRPDHPAIECALSEVVQIESGLEPLFVPFFRNTYILKNLSAGQILDEFYPLAFQNKFLSCDGITFGPDAKIFYRSANLGAEDSQFLRKKEIRILETEVSELDQKLSDAKQTKNSLHFSLSEQKQNYQDLQSKKTDTLVTKESLESAIKSEQDRLDTLEKEIELLQLETEDLQKETGNANIRKEHLRIQLQSCEAGEKELYLKQNELSRLLEAKDQDKSTALKHLAEHRAKFETIDHQNKVLSDSIQILENHVNESQTRLAALEEETQRIEKKSADLMAEDEKLRERKRISEEARREAEIALELIRNEKDHAEKELDKTREDLEQAQAEHQTKQTEAHQSDMKKMDSEYREKTIHERLRQAYRIELASLKSEDYALELPLEELEQKIEELQKKTESLGQVNLLAIEEYEELKTRYDFLLAQEKDLEDSRNALLETIRKINRTTKSLFEETFTSVQNAFQDYYAVLFRGGQARLILVDETNPLESGIDIVVRPPGKRLQHISLLSGGEKALTAIALLFALFKIKPSPFCVLDEVDAPLDEANIDRFLEVLRTFLTVSQFIIVTHNRKTIAMGDSLYGVTMEQAGISKLVSVKVSQDEETESKLDDQDEISSATEDEEEQVSA